MTRPLLKASPLALLAFFPAINILPLFENSTCPGMVKSSKLPVGISVSIPINGACGIVGRPFCSFADCVCSFRPSPCSALCETDVSSGAQKLGKLGECLMLDDESTSVPSVVRLFLAVEWEGARPESRLISLCSLVRAVWGERRWLLVCAFTPEKPFWDE